MSEKEILEAGGEVEWTQPKWKNTAKKWKNTKSED